MSLDEATDSWGIKVERVEIKDVKLPQQLQRAMAAEAEAAREARAKVSVKPHLLNICRRPNVNLCFTHPRKNQPDDMQHLISVCISSACDATP